MEEIRFNPPRKEEPKKEGKKIFKLKFFIIVAILAVLIFIVFANINKISDMFGGEREFYSAVFLTNGEVYFGKILEENDIEIVLKEVFYLQANKTENGSQSVDNKMILAKLNQQFHGPTDELFINRSQVIFYEKLRDDSKVVESIKGL